MKPHERRAAGAYPYFKLAVWDPRHCTFKDGRGTFDTERAARAAARAPGKYRISRVTEDLGRIDLEPFTV